MNDRQTIAWLSPCNTEKEESHNPYLSRMIMRDKVKWYTCVAVTRSSTRYPRDPSWHVTVGGYNRSGKLVPLYRPGTETVAWNEIRFKIAASIAMELMAGVGSDDITVLSSPLVWHFYQPLSGAERANLTKRTK